MEKTAASSQLDRESQKNTDRDESQNLLPRLNLVFNNISYSVRMGLLWREKRNLLTKINGDFRPGELTAIMGPSGAGKSTLMDILAGFTTSKVEGDIKINEKQRDLAAFLRASSYIMQDDKLQLLLTVQEAIEVAADLKLNVTRQKKKQIIDHVLQELGLTSHQKTRTGQLSGGERKRLAIALELINDPPVIFLDEPTSGLDSVTSRQCVGLLRTLAHEGRTVICTIHQPSAIIFNMIDHLYVLVDGNCVYNGGAQRLVPFLSSLGLECPKHYNPADFLMEVCTGEYGDHIMKLVEAVENGKSDLWRSAVSNETINESKIKNVSMSGKLLPETMFLYEEDNKGSAYYATGFWTQLCVLLRRNSIKLSRDRGLTFIRLLMHLLVALIAGIIFFNIGQDAVFALDNFHFLFFSLMFLLFSAFNSTLIMFPTEIPLITREHFNGWYKLRSFYLANKFTDFPVQIIATTVYVTITFFMSGQILEFRRFGLYMMICIMISLIAQIIGQIVGTGLKMQNSMIFGPACVIPFLLFSGYFVHIKDAPPYMHWLFHLSFIKYEFEGIMIVIYGYNRPKLPCSDIYCHFAWPEKLLDTVGMKHSDYWFSMMILVTLYFTLNVFAYILLSIRLKHRHIFG